VSMHVLVGVLAITLTQVVEAKEIDLRKSTDRVGITEIDFCARPSPNELGFPGHSFVILAERDQGKPLQFRAIGQTVAPGVGVPGVVFSYFTGEPVAGLQAEEVFTHVKQACLSVLVDRTVYNNAVQAARPALVLLGLPDNLAAYVESYRLGDNDCITFLMNVANTVKAAGLKVPPRTASDRPLGYVQKLIAFNP